MQTLFPRHGIALRALALAAILSSPALAQDLKRANAPAFARELPKVRSGDPVLEFNGKDLAGFYTYTNKNKLADPQQVFTVKDGVIVISGEDFGAITTKENYKNYHLVTEWRWGPRTFAPRKDKSRDSGILLHCVGEDGAVGGHWMESQECQIIEGGCGDFIMVAGKNKPSLTCKVRKEGNAMIFDPVKGEEVTRNSGRYDWWGRDPKWKDVLGFRGEKDVEAPFGEWNRMEVVCDGDTITNIVNGYVVNVGTKSSHTEGKLQFQSEGAEIHFRKIEIRPLIK
jgi:hypothetical protein